MANPLSPQLGRGQIGTKHLNQSLDALRTVPGPYTVAQLASMTPANHNGVIVLCSNGAAGSACLAYCNGTAWLRVAFGAAVNISS